MKNLIRLLSVLLVVIMIIPLTVSAKYGYTVNDVMCVEKVTPKIDGVFKAKEWGTAADFIPPSYDKSTGSISIPGTVSDFLYFNSKNIQVSGKTYLAFDSANLYVCAQILDPSFCKSDLVTYPVDTSNYVFDGDTFIFSIDPLMKMTNASNGVFYNYSAPSYYVTVDENNTTKLYHVAGVKKGFLDDKNAKSKYNSSTNIWTVEFAIPWNTICEDVYYSSNGILSISDKEKSDMLKCGLNYSHKGTFIYADRSFDEEMEEVITLSVSSTTALSTLDYYPGYKQKGNLVKNFGIKFYLNSHNHSLDYYPAKAATPTANGNKAYYYCSVCNNLYLDKKATKSVSYDDVVIFYKKPDPDPDPEPDPDPDPKPEVKDFKDVPSNTWYTASVKYCVDKGYFCGTSANTFSPLNNMTREQFMQILFKFAGQSKSKYKGQSTGYIDVPSDNWYSPAIIWARKNGITHGIAPKVFGLTRPVTREQFANLLMNYSKKLGLDVSKRSKLTKYVDRNQISSWAVEGMQWAVAEGIIKGTSPTTLQPLLSANRAQATMLFMNYDKYLNKQK